MPLVTMLCAFFVAPLQAQGQSVEAYVQMSADKTTLTFFYDTKRASREGTTWGIEEKKEDHGWQIPAWSSTYNNPNTTTTKAVVDASFKDFRPTSTEFWFKQFKALTAIEGLQNLNTSEVIDMGGMFFGCSRLINLNLSTFNTSNVTNMSDMFDGCKALTSLDLKNFNTSNVMRMSEMFAHCSALTILDLKNFNTSNVTTMSWMFGDCSALTTLDLSSFNTSNVEVMRNMFWGCKSLTSLDLQYLKRGGYGGNVLELLCLEITRSLELQHLERDEYALDVRSLHKACQHRLRQDVEVRTIARYVRRLHCPQGCSGV